MYESDAIVAIATAPGRGAIAIVRLSGGAALEIARQHLHPWPAQARTACLCEVRRGGTRLDEALVTFFTAPDSFTGEDVVEVSTHGGNFVPQSVAAAFIEAGARLALPGEFSRRAVLNGKIDLIQAEAIHELVDARSTAMQQAALVQLDGGLTRKLAALRDQFIDLEALIAYEIDFPEEDDGPVDETRITTAIEAIEAELVELASSANLGTVLREGAVIVIAGPPNSGKSSLFNALIGQAKAIVTEIPGTTRDAIEAVLDAGDFTLRLIDTAGLRSTEDQIERLGIEVSERHVRSADVVLACAESESAMEGCIATVSAITNSQILAVRTKVDLVGGELDSSTNRPTSRLAVSASTREGLTELLDAIRSVLRQTYGERHGESPILTTARQRSAVESALLELRHFAQVRADEGVPASIAAVHIRSAIGALEDLIGNVELEDVLDRLFSTFCVGK